jgi:flagellar biosynthetic protein FlhB
MADEERTEQATPRKRQEARQKGQVARSTEINGAAIFLALVLTLPVAMRWGGERFLAAFQQQIQQAGVGRLSDAIGLSALMVLAPLMAAAFLTALIANAMQVGIYFTAQPLQPDLNRINPVKGFQRLFSQRSAVELLKAVLKFGLIAWVAWRTLQAETERLVAASQLPMPHALVPMTDALYQVGLRVGLLWLVLAILDYLYQRWDFEKTIRMSRYELKEEFKQTEGDPYLRARIRQRMQEAARQRSIRDVRRADVVVTNPVTYAVALRYDRATMNAPRVVAKGKGWLAQRIREEALQMACADCAEPAVGAQPLRTSGSRAGNPQRPLPSRRGGTGICVPPTAWQAVNPATAVRMSPSAATGQETDAGGTASGRPPPDEAGSRQVSTGTLPHAGSLGLPARPTTRHTPHNRPSSGYGRNRRWTAKVSPLPSRARRAHSLARGHTRLSSAG